MYIFILQTFFFVWESWTLTTELENTIHALYSRWYRQFLYISYKNMCRRQFAAGSRSNGSPTTSTTPTSRMQLEYMIIDAEINILAGWLQGHWWGFIGRNHVVRPTFFLMNVFIALKGSQTEFYLTSLQLVLCSVAIVKRLPMHQP